MIEYSKVQQEEHIMNREEEIRKRKKSKSDQNIHTKNQFKVVMRGPSAVLFQQSQNMLIENFSSSIGPVNIRFTSRWIKRDKKLTVPGNLWIEIKGSGPALKDVLVPFANAGLAALPILSLSTNAAIGELEIELGFDNTPGVTERDYFQNYIPPESGIVYLCRLINVEATVALLDALSVHPDAERLRRGANQYRVALDSWKLGQETLTLAHLWMSLEAITKAKIRAECKARGLLKEQELAKSLGVELDLLDATVRKDLILKGDDECYRNARESSEGFEHGFLGYDKLRELSKDVRHRMAGYVRNAIFEICGLNSDTFKILTGEPFDKPMGYWPIVKYVRGQLIGEGEELARPGNEYPFMRWKTIVKSCKVSRDGKLNISFKENFTAEIAKGISFKPHSYEAWRQD